MAYYRRIRELREDNDKTQRELAEYLGTPYQYYAVYEKGKSEISFERAIMLAKYYDVSLDYIAGLTNRKKGLSAELSGEEAELLRFMESFSPEQKKTAAELFKRLAAALTR